MAICKFWQEGRCKFGDSCRYEHPGARSQNVSSNVNRSNNRYASLQGGGNTVSGGFGGGRAGGRAQESALPYHLDEASILGDLRNERPRWEFSAYSPGRNTPRQLFGGYPVEQSPEELRVHLYLGASSGQAQQAEQDIRDLQNRVNQQIQSALNDTRGAVRYIIDGEKEHPNRIDACRNGSLTGSSAQTGHNQNSFSSTTSAFGQTSALDANARPSTFGGPSFGQSSTLGQGSNPFSRPSQFAQTGSSFGQPSTLGQGSSFGKPSQLGGQTSTFGQPSSSSQQSAFGQSSQSSFGKPSFGQPSAPQGPSTLGRPSSQSTSSPFARAGELGQQQSPFAQLVGSGVAPGGGFGGGAFGQPPSITHNPFQQNARSSTLDAFAPETAMEEDQMQGGGLAQPSIGNVTSAPTFPQPPTSTVDRHQTNGTASAMQPSFQGPSAYIRKDSSGRLLAWKNKPVMYQGNLPFYRRDDDRSLERIWFPDGPPQNRDHTEAPEEEYEGNREELEGSYRYLRENNAFKDGEMPEEPPKLEWRRYDM